MQGRLIRGQTVCRQVKIRLDIFHIRLTVPVLQIVPLGFRSVMQIAIG